MYFLFLTPKISTTTEDYRNFVLTAPMLFSTEHTDGTRTAFCVPAGFVTNYASVPAALHSLVDPQGKQARPAIAHDYLYGARTTCGPRCYSRRWCDAVLRAALKADGCPPWRRWMVWAAVRLFGASYWRLLRPSVAVAGLAMEAMDRP